MLRRGGGSTKGLARLAPPVYLARYHHHDPRPPHHAVDPHRRRGLPRGVGALPRPRPGTPALPEVLARYGGLEGNLTCPECGRDARRASRLTRTRRRWRLAVPFLLATILLPTWLRPAIDRRHEGWTALLPTTGLIVVYKWTPKEHHLVDELLKSRQARLRGWQIQLIGAWVAPVSADMAADAVLFRRVWFRGEPIPIECRYPRELSVAYFAGAIEVVDSQGDLIANDNDMNPPWSVWYTYPGYYQEFMSQALLPATDAASVSYPVTVRMRHQWQGPGPPSGGTIERSADHDRMLSIRLIDRADPQSMDQIITPVRSAALDQMAIEAAAIRFSNLPPFDTLWFSLREVDRDERQRGIAFVMEVEVLDGDAIIWSLSRLPSSLSWDGLQVSWGNSQQNSRLLSRIIDWDRRLIDPHDLTVRIRSRQDLAIYCLEYDRYWKGEITLPFLELFENQHPDFTVVGE